MNFESILDKKMDDIEAPKALPKGNYLFSIDEQYKQEKMGQDDAYTKIEFSCTVREAGDDVDADALAEFGTAVGYVIRMPFIFSNDADTNADSARKNDGTMNRLKIFLENSLEIEAGTMKEALGMVVGRSFYGTVDHRPNKNNPEEVFAEIRKTAPVDA